MLGAGATKTTKDRLYRASNEILGTPHHEKEQAMISTRRRRIPKEAHRKRFRMINGTLGLRPNFHQLKDGREISIRTQSNFSRHETETLAPMDNMIAHLRRPQNTVSEKTAPKMRFQLRPQVRSTAPKRTVSNPTTSLFLLQKQFPPYSISKHLHK